MDPTTGSDMSFQVEGRDFLAQGTPLEATLSGGPISGPPIVLWPPTAPVTRNWVSAIIREWQRIDDVFHLGFTRNVILARTSPSQQITLADDFLPLLDDWNAQMNYVVSTQKVLPPGPYLVWNEAIHAVLRLFPDTQEAFMVATVLQHKSSDVLVYHFYLGFIANAG